MLYDYLHEAEVVELQSETPRPLSELLQLFTSLGFTIHDDVVSQDRKDTVLPWQHSSVVEVETQLRGEEVFGFDNGEWDVILLRYLFASLPFENVDKFIENAVKIRNRLGLQLIFRGKPIESESLRCEFGKIRDGLLAETGSVAGSEELAILIDSTYPR